MNFQETLEWHIWRKHPASGIFLEIGAWDGEHLSNTAFLERKYGWQGWCVDPFPRNFENRTCILVRAALGLYTGEREFVKVSNDRRYGGDVSYFSGFRESLSFHWPMIQEFCDYEVVKVEALSVMQFLEQYKLPHHIDFLSVDVEGAEVELFSALDFTKYSFGLIVFEHNGQQEPKRAVGGILAEYGYRRIEEFPLDDLYEGRE